MPQCYSKNDSGYLQGCFYCFEGERDCRLQKVNFILGNLYNALRRFWRGGEGYYKNIFCKGEVFFSAVAGRRKGGEPPRKEAVRVRKSPD